MSRQKFKVWVAVADRTGQLLEVEERRIDVSDAGVWRRRVGPVTISPATLTIKQKKAKKK